MEAQQHTQAALEALVGTQALGALELQEMHKTTVLRVPVVAVAVAVLLIPEAVWASWGLGLRGAAEYLAALRAVAVAAAAAAVALALQALTAVAGIVSHQELEQEVAQFELSGQETFANSHPQEQQTNKGTK